MLDRLHLIVSFDKIYNEINSKMGEGDSLLKISVTNESEVEELKTKVNNWINSVLTIFQTAFNSTKNVFENDFYEAYPSFYEFPGSKKTVKQLHDEQMSIIRQKQFVLLGNLKILSVSDAIIKPQKIDLNKRSQYSIEEKLKLLIVKLYQLNDDFYYPVRQILWGNGIELKRTGEERELIEILEDKEFVNVMGGIGSECNAQLTSKGIMYYEANLKPKFKKDTIMNQDDEIKIFISHGGSHLWKDVARYIEKELGIETIILQERPIKGRTVIEKLEEETEDCDFAIIVMTAEDEQKDGSLRARQNVIHEIGFCQGVFGRNKVLVLKQKGSEAFTNISGIVYEEFIGENIKSTFHKIKQEIEELEEELEEEEEEEDTEY